MDEGEAQRFHTRQSVGIGSFRRTRFAAGKVGVELKSDGQVMRQNRQLLPSAVGGVMVSRHRVEREFALELGEGLLLGPTASHEVPQGGRAQWQVSGDG